MSIDQLTEREKLDELAAARERVRIVKLIRGLILLPSDPDSVLRLIVSEIEGLTDEDRWVGSRYGRYDEAHDAEIRAIMAELEPRK